MASPSVSAQHKFQSILQKSLHLQSVEDLSAVNSVGGCSEKYSSIMLTQDKGAITWGILIMFYISYGCSFMSGAAAFRIPWGLQMLPAIFLFAAMMFLPESPRWLAKKDRWEEAVNVLALGMYLFDYVSTYEY